MTSPTLSYALALTYHHRILTEKEIRENGLQLRLLLTTFTVFQDPHKLHYCIALLFFSLALLAYMDS